MVFFRTARLMCLGLCALVMLILTVTLSRADSTIQISVALPDALVPRLTPGIISRFEAAHPGVHVTVRASPFDFAPAGNDVNGYLDRLRRYAESADILLIWNNYLTPLATRSGLLLSLDPLLNADSSVDPRDYTTLQAFRWDNTTWAFPVDTNPLVVAYVPDVFDRLGLPYPDASSTFESLIRAAQAIARDQTGTKAGIGISPPFRAELIRAALGHGFYDSTSGAPKLDTPDLAGLLAQWITLENAGMVDTTNDLAHVPLQVITMAEYVRFRGSSQRWAWSLLPGGTSVLNTTGFAISRGTSSPEAAYQLAVFLANQPDFRLGGIPARRDLVEAATAAYPPAVRALLPGALDAAIPDSEVRYGDYVQQAITEGSVLGVSAVLARQEQLAQVDLQIAEARKATMTAFSVATPIPTPVNPNKITLKFGGDPFIAPNNQIPADLVANFVANDPQVAQIDIDFQAFNQYDFPDQVKKYDCFIRMGNAVPGIDTRQLRNVDPLIDADPTFDKADVVGGLLSQVQRDGKTWAVPLYLAPFGLIIDQDAFTKAGIPLPSDTWTIAEFADALKTLRESTDSLPFHANTSFSYTLALIAAYGGLPFDFRTSPPTVHFTDPATVGAIRQTLDLFREGYIPYKKFRFGQPFDMVKNSLISTEDVFGPLYLDRINRNGKHYGWAMYPRGSSYQPVFYSTGTAYISAYTPYPEACYRWINLLRKHPDVLGGLPAYKSVLNDPAYQSLVGPEVSRNMLAFYDLLAKPDTLFLPSDSIFIGKLEYEVMFFQENWLFEAFDAYIGGNDDLEALLKKADGLTREYLACTARLHDTSTEIDYWQQLYQCAVQVDPGVKAALGR